MPKELWEFRSDIERLRKKREEEEANRALDPIRERNPLYEALGQAVWGAAETLTLGGLEISDIAEEAVSGERDRMEKAITSLGGLLPDTYEGDFTADPERGVQELTGWGKVGYTIGSIAGTIPTFMLGGALTSKGISAAGKVGGWGTKFLSKKAGKEIIEAGTKKIVAGKTGMVAAKELTQEAAEKVASESIDAMSKKSLARLAQKQGGDELFTAVAKKDIANSISKHLGIADDALVQFTDEVFKIATHNNPARGQDILFGLGTAMGGKYRKSGMIAGAMAYDALLGTVIGTARGTVDSAIRAGYEWEEPESYAMKILKDAGHEALALSVIGPVKFLKGFGQGGSRGSLIKKARDTTVGIVRNLTAPKLLSKEALRTNVRFMYTLTDNKIGTSKSIMKIAGTKWMNKGKDWFETAERAELREFLNVARKSFLKDAPKYWVNEFGAEMWQSIPRMAAGVVAMHAMGLLDTIKQGGIENAKFAFGRTPEERISNIFTAMYFTRRPHSFHSMEKMLLFNTKDIKRHASEKGRQLAHTIGGLRSIGIGRDYTALSNYMKAYGPIGGRERNISREADEKFAAEVLEASPEIVEIKNFIDKYSLEKNITGGGMDFIQAAVRYNEKVNGDDPAAQEIYRDKIAKVQKILEFYKETSLTHQELGLVTSDQAHQIVQKLSTMKFGGKDISTIDPGRDLSIWYENKISEATTQPITVIKSFVKAAYNALGLTFDDTKSMIEVEKIADLVDLSGGTGEALTKSHDAQYSLINAIKQLKNMKLLREAKGESKTKEFTVEQKQNVLKAYDGATDALHEWLYGAEWSAEGKLFDAQIMTNDAWYIPYRALQNNVQTRNAIALLTGSGDHTMPVKEAADLINDIGKVMKSKIRPKIDETDLKSEVVESDEYKEVVKFINRLHSIVELTNPTLDTVEAEPLTYEKAIELKRGMEKVIGDSFAEDRAFDYLKLRALDNSMDKLGLASIESSYNIKAGIQSLMLSGVFTKPDGGYAFPERDSMIKYLKALQKEGKITEVDEYVEFYDTIIAAIDKSRFGVIDINPPLMAEKSKGEWFETLKRAHLQAKYRTSESALDEARKLAGEMGSLEEKLKTIIAQEIEYIQTVGTEDKKAHKSLLQTVMQTQQDIINFTNDIKSARYNKNSLLLHSIISRTDQTRAAIKAISKGYAEGNFVKYAQELVKIHEAARDDAERHGMKEASLFELVEKSINQLNIPDRDVVEATIRISSAQFSLRYGVSSKDLHNLMYVPKEGQIEAEVIRKSMDNILNEVSLLANLTYPKGKGFSQKDRAAIDRLRKSLKKAPDLMKGNAEDWKKFVIDPLFKTIKYHNIFRKYRGLDVWDEGQALHDIYSVVNAFSSSVPVRQIQYDRGRLIYSDRPFGYAPTRGVTGLINILGTGNDMAVMSNTIITKKGKTFRIFNDSVKQEISDSLNNNPELVSQTGVRDYIFEGKLPTGELPAESALRDRWQLIDLDESTVLMIRTDEKSNVRTNLRAQLTPTGELYGKLDAMGLVNHRGLRDILAKAKDNRAEFTDDNIVEGIKLARMILDMPHLIDKYYAGEVSEEQLKQSWKYLKLTEAKNGFIGSSENMIRSKVMLEYLAKADKSGYYKKVLNVVKDWVTPDKDNKFKKMKVLSVADERSKESFADDKRNIFSSLEKARVQWIEMVVNKEMTADELALNLASAERFEKSVIDGEFLVSKEVYLTSLALMGGMSKETVLFDDVGNVTNIKAGGIKPSITHVDINSDISDRAYGRTKVFYAKTAFKYRPEFDALFKQFGVDAITFKSANKINEFKYDKKADWRNSDIDKVTTDNTFATVKGVDEGDVSFGENLVSWMGRSGNLIFDKGDVTRHITHIPFSAINLKTIGTPHDPMVSANMGVHMHENNGISYWIGLENKLNSVKSTFMRHGEDMYYRTALARKVLGYSAELGDMAFVNSGLDFVLQNNGMITDKWMRQHLDERIIPYFMNNGSIAGGRVPEGSYDVMAADFIGMKVPVRSEVKSDNDIFLIGGKARRTLKFFGEFLPSINFANKKYKRFGYETGRQRIGSSVVHRVEYFLKKDGPKNLRKADGFFVNLDTVVKGLGDVLIVEGIGINKDGDFIDLNTFTTRDAAWSSSAKGKKIQTLFGLKHHNRQAFEKAFNRQKEIDLLYVSGDTYGLMAEKIFKKFGDKNSIGILNSRQPRNQVGDLVINKMKVFKDPSGKIITNNGKFSGNLSVVNFLDAIHPQDADFDMDKSMMFGAAPHQFWAEAGRLAGYDAAGDVETVSRLFMDVYSNEYPQLFKHDRYKDELNAIDQARGRFVKMHQTMTYLANMFKDGRTVMTFEEPTTQITRPRYKVVVNDWNQNYIKTAERVTDLVKQFLDMYKQAPTEILRDVEARQWDILFGKEGMFSIKKVTALGKEESTDFVLNDYTGPRDAIVETFIRPINQYLRYNRGTTIDESNREIKATLDDYYHGYQNLLWSMNPKFGRDYGKLINMKMGLEAADSYFNLSLNPFDRAMKDLYQIRHDQTANFSENRYFAKDLINYVLEGKTPEGWKDPEGKALSNVAVVNKFVQQALREMVTDEAKIVELEDLTSTIAGLDYKIADMDRWQKNEALDTNKIYQDLVKRRNDAIEIKVKIEEAISYMKNAREDIDYVKNPGFKRTGDYKNTTKKPIVIIDGYTYKTKEVIMPGKRNDATINPKDRLILNGKRFEVVRGDDHLALEATYLMFGGEYQYYNKATGEHRSITKGEDYHIQRIYNDMVDRIRNDWRDLDDTSKYSIEEYALKRVDHIMTAFGDTFIIGDQARTEAFIAKMLLPAEVRNVTAITPIKGVMGNRAVFGQRFTENPYAKVAYQFLAQIANGTNVMASIDRNTAMDILKNITELKKIGVGNMKNKAVDIKMDTERSFTKPVDFKVGFMADEYYLDQSIFNQLKSANENARLAAKVMIDMMNGERMIDSATLYRASKEMERQGIPVDKQFIRTRYEEGRYFGKQKIIMSISERMGKRYFGEGGSVEESAKKTVKEAFCNFRQ